MKDKFISMQNDLVWAPISVLRVFCVRLQQIRSEHAAVCFKGIKLINSQWSSAYRASKINMDTLTEFVLVRNLSKVCRTSKNYDTFL